MSAAVRRRYERLLRLCPADYRRERGAEMLSTLMEGAGPEQRRPDPREARRAGAGRWLLAVPVAALLGFYLPGWANGRSETLVLLGTYAILAVAGAGLGAILARRQTRV